MKRFAALAAVSLALVWAAQPAYAQSQDEFFESRVRPVLAAKCYECHAQVRRGGLRVNSLEALLAGGRSGPAIVPGDPDNSLLIQVVRHEVPDLEMPQDGDPLTSREIQGLAEWIRMEAPWPEDDLAVVAASTDVGLSPGAQIFVDRVRPVLERSCFACHTNDERGGLRLDSRERVLQGGSRGAAVVPGNPEGSLLITALRHERDDLQMPRNAGKLSDEEIAGFVAWIQAGAEWADVASPIAIPRRAVTDEERAFWSFLPLTHHEPPPGDDGWARTDIDRFVEAKLREQGLSPVGPVGKRELIRRATFDLIGLPPTPDEVQAFLDDTSAEAFETVVDRLLTSEHYGERWGRHWLDVIRFGEDDTRGLARDGSGRERYPMAYVQRDWVVNAFNGDMPYDDFVVAHLAADLLPTEERTDVLPALGFLGQGPWYYDLADPPIARADERHDRVDVTSRAFLGLTVGCARCHDHKYDPIGTHDYYSFAGVFDNASYYEYPIADSATAAEFKADQEFIKDMEEGLRDYLRTEGQQLARVLTLQTSKYMMAAWKVTGSEDLPVERAATQGRLDVETLQRWIDFLDDEPKHYPYLADWQAMIADEGGSEERAEELADAFERLLLELVAEQKELEELNSKIIARGTPLEEVKSTPMPNGFESFFDEHQLELDAMERERFNLYADVFLYDLDNELDTFFPKPALLRFSGWGLERQLSRVAADHVVATREEIEQLKKDLPDIPFVMGVQDKDSTDIRDIGLHIRGNPKSLGARVPRSFLHVLEPDAPETYSEGSGRLALARDIAEHPITARVIVNRVWAWHMGSGIVASPSNFGFAGDAPTHPELLDALTARFVEGGMSIKSLHREIMLSSVYRLAAGDDAEARERDPANRYYWRFNRQRLDAEAIRDALLYVSGSLDATVGGKTSLLTDSTNVRRTIYGEVSRFQLNEFLQTFDFPNPSLSAERRFSTNVPLQSLYFMNSPFVQRQAEALVTLLAAQAAKEDSATVADNGERAGSGGSGGNGRSRSAGDDGSRADASPVAPRRSSVPDADDEAKDDEDLPEAFHDRRMIALAYPRLYGREVTEQEVQIGLDFLAEQRASWAADAAESTSAEDDAGTAEITEEEGAAEAALAARHASMKAWVQYARALFSAAEFRFID